MSLLIFRLTLARVARHTEAMKINSAMRILVKLQVIIGCAAAVAVLGLACFVSATVATEIGQTIGQTAVHQIDGLPVPNMDLGDLMAAVR